MCSHQSQHCWCKQEELDIKELPSVWAALHAHLLRQLRRKALDQHSTPQEAILEMTGSMLKHIRTLLEQQPAHSLDMLELAIAATAASFAQVTAPTRGCNEFASGFTRLAALGLLPFVLLKASACLLLLVRFPEP